MLNGIHHMSRILLIRLRIASPNCYACADEVIVISCTSWGPDDDIPTGWIGY